MRMRLYPFVIAGMVIWLAACVASTTQTDLQPVEKDGVPRISIQQLKDILGQEELVLLDTRPTQQWKASTKKIPGSVHHSSFKVQKWADEYEKNATIVTYCA